MPNSPMDPQNRAAMYKKILESRLAPPQEDDSQTDGALAAGIGSGIEQIAKGMLAGGAGAGDTGHWDRSRQIFKQRADERARRGDRRLGTLEKLQKIDTDQAKTEKEESRYQDTRNLKLAGISESRANRKADQERAQDKIDKADKITSFKNVNDLRKNYFAHPTTKATDSMDTAYRKIASAAENPSAAGDLSLIFGYMKMLDPGSTVREGEFATAQNATGVPERVLNSYNRVMSGERLSKVQRGDFSGQAKNVWDAQLASQKQVDDRFKDFGSKYDIDFGEFAGQWGAGGAQSSPGADQVADAPPAGDQQASTGPQGRVVEQDGVTYVWDGTEYKPKEADPATATAGSGGNNGIRSQ